MEEKILDNNAVSEDGEIMVKIENVTKQYKLGMIGGTTLKEALQRTIARIRKKEDPTKKIGAKNYNKGEKFMALNGVSFEVKKGEAIGLIGHNGAGKSTLLKLITRVTAPTSGKIYLNGRVASMLEVGTGFHGELTGRENIYMNGAILGMTKKEIDAKIEDIIDFSEVRQFIDTPVKRYSSGMFVKLAFSVAAHLDAEIVLMDEVLAVGDMAFQNKCIKKMREIADSGKTIIYVSHNMNTIRALCDRCVVLNKGEVEFVGGVEDSIAIYMGSKMEMAQVKSFSIEDHEKWLRNKVFITSCEILNNINLLTCGDILNLKLNYNSLANLKGLRSRIVILNKEYNIVGMSLSKDVFNIEETNSGILDISLETNIFAPGEYSAHFSMFYLNEFGGHEYVCVLNHFIRFNLLDAPLLHHGMQWKSRSWGNVAYPDFAIEVKK